MNHSLHCFFEQTFVLILWLYSLGSKNNGEIVLSLIRFGVAFLLILKISQSNEVGVSYFVLLFVKVREIALL